MKAPWNNLGVDLDPTMTPAEALRAAKLDWEVLKLPMYSKLNNSEFIVPGHSQLLRESDAVSLGICGPEYRPFQNSQIFEFFSRFTEAGAMTLETFGSLNGGRLIWALANMGQSVEVGKGDEVKGYLLLVQPHIWGKAMT